MFYEDIKEIGLPVVYSHSKKGVKTPYLAYLGAGQNQFKADNTRFDYQNLYQLEYYFDKKNEELESSIEEKILEKGYHFEKSEDVFLDEEDVFLIYYQII